MNDASLIGGRYRLGDLLGVGGSASVHQAHDIVEGAEVAVKLLHPHLCTDDETRDAFLDEAWRAQQLHHPNLTRVHDAGLHDAGGMVMPWIAMDLLRGPTLADWVTASGRLDAADAAAVLDGVLAGLAAVHRHGMAHRDLSPQNVVLEGAEDRKRGERLKSGMVRLLDFGLAAVTGQTAHGTDVLLAHRGDSDATSIVGNAHFMSPEQAQGLPVRAVGDLYQAGALLYYALTASTPFPRQTLEQVLQAHVSAPPPVPSSLVPEAQPFDRIVARAMTKTPARRYRDTTEFREALKAVADGLPSAGAPTPDEEGATLVLHGAVVPEAHDLEYLHSYRAAAGDERPAAVERPAATGVVAAAVAAVLVGLAVWSTIGAGATPTAPPAPSTVAAPIAVATNPPTPVAPAETAPPPEPAATAVPAVHGTLADAEVALRAVGLVVGAVHRQDSAETADRVLAQRPLAGEAVPPGTPVELTVASGRNLVPHVDGMTVAGATAALETAGFAIAVPPGAVSGSLVRGTDPSAGTLLRVGVTVTLVPAPLPSAPATPPPAPVPTGEPEERP